MNARLIVVYRQLARTLVVSWRQNNNSIFSTNRQTATWEGYFQVSLALKKKHIQIMSRKCPERLRRMSRKYPNVVRYNLNGYSNYTFANICEYEWKSVKRGKFLHIVPLMCMCETHRGPL